MAMEIKTVGKIVGGKKFITGVKRVKEVTSANFDLLITLAVLSLFVYCCLRNLLSS